MPNKHKALAEMSVAMEVEFDESEIPAGMDKWDYAYQLAETGAFVEKKNGGDFLICDIVSEEDDEQMLDVVILYQSEGDDE